MHGILRLHLAAAYSVFGNVPRQIYGCVALARLLSLQPSILLGDLLSAAPEEGMLGGSSEDFGAADIMLLYRFPMKLHLPMSTLSVAYSNMYE